MGLEQLELLIRQSNRLCVFTGAGVSTLSGIRDFRGKNGLYKDYDADKIFDIDYFHQDPDYYYRMTWDFLYDTADLKPSLVHQVLARWEAEGRLKALVTQNIDGLHQRAGSKRVLEVHGSARWHHCLGCGAAFGFDEIRGRLEKKLQAPRCACGSPIKPDITFFGETLPEAAWEGAWQAAGEADLMLVLGSSLVVQPAAQIPALTLRRGGQVVIVNDGATPLDSQAVLKFTSLEEVFGQLS